MSKCDFCDKPAKYYCRVDCRIIFYLTCGLHIRGIVLTKITPEIYS